MTKQAGPSIYIPTDKNIFDALKHKKVTQLELVGFLRRRGILVSRSASKDDLVVKISSLTFDYSDFNWLGKLLENPNRKDKTTHSQLKGAFSPDQIQAACNIAKLNITANDDDSVKVARSGQETTLTVTYVDVDFTKTELRQRTLKTCDITVEATKDGVLMKMPSTKKARELSEKLKTVLASQLPEGEPFEEVCISLEGIVDPKARSEFFDILIKNTNGYAFDTVTSVNVYHHVEKIDDDDDDDDGVANARLASYINKAVLAGEGVLESQEFNQLHARGFYIYRIIWKTASDNPYGEKVEFEAQFGSPANCSDFKYTTRGVYNYNDKTETHNVTRRASTQYENKLYDAVLRDASEVALTSVKKQYGRI